MLGIIFPCALQASYRICREYAELIRQSVYKLLGTPQRGSRLKDDEDKSEIEFNINSYLQSNADKYNIEQMVKVSRDYPRFIHL